MLNLPPPVPGCRWPADNLLVRVRKAAKLPLPQALLRHAFTARVACAVNLLSKDEFLTAGADALFGPLADALEARPAHQRRAQSQVFMTYMFWPEAGELPTARQVRQAIDTVEDAHAIGLRVLLNGVGHPARATLVAGCWLAREGCGGDLVEERLAWLEDEPETPDQSPATCTLSVAERIFVAEWPTGRDGQPRLADMEHADRDEVFPFATIEHWLRTLPTVRVYPGTRGHVRGVDVPVLDYQHLSDGADIDLDLDELRRGTWVGERTLRLPRGWQVVFNSPHR